MEKRHFDKCEENRSILDEAYFTWLGLNQIDDIAINSELKSRLRTIKIVLNVGIVPFPILTILGLVLTDVSATITTILYISATMVFIIWALVFIREMKYFRAEVKKWMNTLHKVEHYHILYPSLYFERINYRILTRIVNNGKPTIILERAFLKQQMSIVLESFNKYASSKIDYNDEFFNSYGNLISTIVSGTAIVLLTTIGLEFLPIKIIVLLVCWLALVISIEYFGLYIENQMDHVRSILANRCANDLRMAYEYVIELRERLKP